MDSIPSLNTSNVKDLMFLAQQCCARINDDMYALLLLSGFDIKDIDACDGLLCNTFGYPYSPAPQPEEPDPFEELDEEVYEAIELACRLFTTRVSNDHIYNDTLWRFEDDNAAHLIYLQLDERKFLTLLESSSKMCTRPFRVALYDLHSYFSNFMEVYPRFTFVETENSALEYSFISPEQTYRDLDLLQCDIFKKIADSLLLRQAFKCWSAKDRSNKTTPLKRKYLV